VLPGLIERWVADVVAKHWPYEAWQPDHENGKWYLYGPDSDGQLNTWYDFPDIAAVKEKIAQIKAKRGASVFFDADGNQVSR
jgi:hypothetical protein